MCVDLCENITSQLRKVLTCSKLLSTCVYPCEQSLASISERILSCSRALLICFQKISMRKILDLNKETSLPCSGCLFYAFAYAEKLLNSVQEGICPAPGSCPSASSHANKYWTSFQTGHCLVSGSYLFAFTSTKMCLSAYM